MPAGFRKELVRTRIFFNEWIDQLITVQEWKNGDVRLVGDFGKDFGKSDRTFEETCEKYLEMGYEEYIRKGV